MITCVTCKFAKVCQVRARISECIDPEYYSSLVPTYHPYTDEFIGFLHPDEIASHGINPYDEPSSNELDDDLPF